MCFFCVCIFNCCVICFSKFFITRLKYWQQTYLIPLFSIGYTISVTFRKTTVLKYYHLLRKIIDDLNKMNVLIEVTFRELYVLYFVQFLSALIILTVDLYYHKDNYDVYFWICQYLPNIAIHLYLMSIFYCWTCCTQIFITINNFLKPLCYSPLTILEKHLISRKNIKPELLLKKYKSDNKIYFEKMFIIHNDTCNIIRKLENMTLLEFTAFFYYSAVAMAALAYDTALDLIRMSNDIQIPPKKCYATIYCPIMATIIFVSVVRFGSRTMYNANRTKDYLHKLVNLYPTLIPYVSIANFY